MAATDAKPVPRKNAAFRFYFAIRKPSDGTLITTWTGADSEVSLDGAAFSDCTNEATEIGTTGCGYLDLTSSEMNADAVVLKITVTNTGAVPLVYTFFPEEAGDYRADATHWGGTAVASANVLIDGAITAAKIAADAITDAKVASDVTIASVTGAVGSIATGGITASSFAAGAIDNAAIAADAIGSSELGASAVTEIQSGLSTLTQADIRTAVGLASANLDTQIATLATAANLAIVAGYIDTEIAAIKAKTDNLPTDPADQSAVEAAITASQGTVTTAIDALPTLAEILAGGDVDGYTIEQTLKIVLAAVAGKLSGAATTTNTIRAADDSKARITATVDADGNRTAVTLDGSG